MEEVKKELVKNKTPEEIEEIEKKEYPDE